MNISVIVFNFVFRNLRTKPNTVAKIPFLSRKTNTRLCQYASTSSRSTLTVTLDNHSYVFEETGFYWFQIVFLGIKHLTLLSPEDNINFLLEYDKFVTSAEDIVERECINYLKHKKSSQILTEAANAILKDILATEQNVFFRIDAQKNGYFRCRVMELAEWMPGKTIRTDLEHLREDFIGALKDVRNRREFGVVQ